MSKIDVNKSGTQLLGKWELVELTIDGSDALASFKASKQYFDYIRNDITPMIYIVEFLHKAEVNTELLKTPLDFLAKSTEKSIFTNLDPRFVNFSENNFELDTLSPVIDKGNINIGNLVPIDYNGNLRTSDIAPDLGAFERVP